MNIKFTQKLVDYNKIVGDMGFLDPAIFVGKVKEPIQDVRVVNAKIYKIDDYILVDFDHMPKSKEIALIEDEHGPFLYRIVKAKSYAGDDLDAIIIDAIEMRATDIHLEPKEDKMGIRFRIDGVLKHISYMYQDFDRLSNIIKVRSGMDTVNKEMQDGSMDFKFNSKDLSIRVSSVPTQFGEKFVLRLLNSNQIELDLIKLGMPEDVIDTYKKHINKEGMNLVVGPTGSGKNTTMHAALKLLPHQEKNIISIEDPIEYRADDITQLEVDNSRGRTFNKLLRASLRQDPDIIYIGEIRDEETAQVAMRSAITGHTVFSTLHTRDDKNTYDRLLDLGVEEYILKTAISTIISQRLVRTLCDCKIKTEDGHYMANGCDKCNNGYYGRTGVFELSVADDGRGEFKFKKIIDRQESLRRLYEEGKIDLKTFEEENDI